MTNTKPNAKRKRPMVTLTLAPETVDRIETLRGVLSRGEYVDMLVEDDAVMVGVAKQLHKRSKRKKDR